MAFSQRSGLNHDDGFHYEFEFTETTVSIGVHRDGDDWFVAFDFIVMSVPVELGQSVLIACCEDLAKKRVPLRVALLGDDRNQQMCRARADQGTRRWHIGRRRRNDRVDHRGDVGLADESVLERLDCLGSPRIAGVGADDVDLVRRNAGVEVPPALKIVAHALDRLWLRGLGRRRA